MDRLCPNCGDDRNELDAQYCETCGSRLGSSLFLAPPPPEPMGFPSVVAGAYAIQGLLWSAPTYNAYSAVSASSPGSGFTILEQPVLQARTPETSRSLHSGTGYSEEQRAVAAAFERFGVTKPKEHLIENGNLYTSFEQLQGQPLGQLDQASEKETRSIGLQLCAFAEELHRHGFVFNGFEPYGVIIDREGRVRLIGFDRIRRAGTVVADAPIYPSRGYTAPELFEPAAKYDSRSDIFSIGALLQFLLTGEEPGPADGATLYPIATLVPKLERLFSRALDEKPADRFQTIDELRNALYDLNLPIVLQSGHFTDVGLIRELNEDSVLALNLTQYYESVQTQIGLYVVSDGMGGEAAGEVASRITVRAMAEYVTENLISASLKSTRAEKIVAPTHTGGLRLAVADGNEMATTELLRLAVINANREVLAYANTHPQERGLGATVTAVMIVGELLTVAQVGDSRCYLMRGDRLEQLTEDHSLVQRMINTGDLSRSEARLHPYRNVIYRSIGADDQIEIDIIRRQLKTGDVILLCSDGLNTMLSDDQIRDILMVNSDPNQTAKELVVAANASGGEDNISAIVVRIS